MRLAWFVLFFVVLFIWHAYRFANYDTEIWVSIYYIWDKTKDFFTFILITQLLIAQKESEKLIACFKIWTFFLGCRIIWEWVVIIIGEDINHPEAMKWFFYLCWLLIFYTIMYPSLIVMMNLIDRSLGNLFKVIIKFIWKIKKFFLSLRK